MKKSFLKWFTDQLPIKYIAGIIKDAYIFRSIPVHFPAAY